MGITDLTEAEMIVEVEDNGVLGFRVVEFGCGVLGSGVVAEADLLLVDTIYLEMAGTVSFPVTYDGGLSSEGEIVCSKLEWVLEDFHVERSVWQMEQPCLKSLAVFFFLGSK